MDIDLKTIYELWSERAAIREFDGGMLRGEAEFEALRDAMRMLRMPVQKAYTLLESLRRFGHEQ